MRKKRIMPAAQPEVLPQGSWLDIETLAQIEITSEEASNPIELAFSPDIDYGWKAAEPGRQMVRLLFDQPQNIQCIELHFQEKQQVRTQEFLLRYSSDGGKSYQDIVRQQYNFSPPAIVCQKENYMVALKGVTIVELIINPDISGGNAHASLAGLRLM